MINSNLRPPSAHHPIPHGLTLQKKRMGDGSQAGTELIKLSLNIQIIETTDTYIRIQIIIILLLTF